MDQTVRDILDKVRNAELSVEEGAARISALSRGDLGYATVDLDRERRTGRAEVVFGAGKTPEQILGIARVLHEKHGAFLVTRAAEAAAEKLLSAFPEASWNPLARTVALRGGKRPKTEAAAEASPGGKAPYIAVVAAGTSDLPVAEEARITAEFFGSRVVSVTDVGVAGIHRLFAKLDIIRGAKVVVVAAGMEGTLASVVGGLVGSPVIAVPTSVGYGANFGGLSALLTMLNSCAAGVSVVNIDNGFGAGFLADMINRID